MMTLYCDESDDGETYALAGWLATPTCWKHFDLAWRAMLLTVTMPNGSPCPGFHASEIENQAETPISPPSSESPSEVPDSRTGAGVETEGAIERKGWLGRLREGLSK